MSTLHGSKNEPADPVRVANVGPQDLATNQKQDLPWICGEEKVSLLWIGEVYNQYTVDAPIERPGKK